jgi:predicted small metal-binding protein
MLTVSCKDLASDCEFVGRARTEDELMMQLVGHIIKKHEVRIEKVMTQEMREKIREHMEHSR